MIRESSPPRPGWRERLEAVGFDFHSVGGVYWDESVCYRFTAAEIDLLEDATAELQRLCLAAVEHIVAENRYGELAVPEPFREWVAHSWRRAEPALYGRFDLCYDGQGPPKLLEYNADTPTSLLETSVAQWFWLEDVHPEADQFNALHECLIERWQTLRRGEMPLPLHLHFAGVGESEEDFGTLEYLRDTAIQGGFTTWSLGIEQIGWNGRAFLDLEGRPIRALFKLYPWEWLIQEEFGPLLRDNPPAMVEPPWKMLLSNKGLLAILWELFPDHPYLLPSAFGPEGVGESYVRKPFLSREGANIEIHRPGQVLRAPGDYGAEGWVYQAYAPLPCFDGRNHVVVGSWVVGDRPAGMGLREDDSPITRDTSRFIPHYFHPEESV